MLTLFSDPWFIIPIILLSPVLIWIAMAVLCGTTIAATSPISRWWFWVVLIIIGLHVVPKTHGQETIPLEQYVQQYFKNKAAREALEARLPKPKATPIPQLPPYPNIFAPYHARSLLDSVPRRDYEPLYVRPELVPSPTPTPTPQPKSRPTPKPTRETFYVSQ